MRSYIVFFSFNPENGNKTKLRRSKISLRVKKRVSEDKKERAGSAIGS